MQIGHFVARDYFCYVLSCLILAPGGGKYIPLITELFGEHLSDVQRFPTAWAHVFNNDFKTFIKWLVDRKTGQAG